MRGSDDTQGLKVALGVYLLVFAMKLVAYFMTGVMALLAEALHTLSDIFVTAFLLVATLWSRKQADSEHVFGHGRAQNVAALVAATLFISFTSYKLYEEAIPRLFKSGEATYESLPLALGVLIFSMLISTAPLVTLFRQKVRGAAAKAQLIECVNDELGLLAALLGTLFITWGWPIADPIATIVVATIIAYNAIGLFRENLSLLLGRSPAPEFLAHIESLVLSVDGVLGVHDLRVEYIGPDTLHGGMHIQVRQRTPIEEADHIAEQVRVRIEQATGCRYCVIHVDPVQGVQD